MTDIKLVCFDLDDTLTTENSWAKLNVAFGITPEEDYAMYRQFVDGEISYLEWTEKLATLYRERGVATEAVALKAFHSIELVAGASELMRNLRSKGYELAVLSASFNHLATDVAGRLGINLVYGCAQLECGGNGKVTNLFTHDDEEGAKVQKLHEWCDELSIDITEVACVGDGANDRKLFQATGHGITFTDSPIKEV